MFPMTGGLLLAISPKLHGLVVACTDTSGEEWSYDLDDELQDLSCFLEAGSRSFVQRNTPYPGPPIIREESSFEELSAIILLSRKYGSSHLYHAAVAWLECQFTPDAAGFNMRTPPGFLETGAIGVLNLARTINHSSLLAGAIFACCRLSVDDLTNGYTREDRGKETLQLEDIVRVRLTRDRLLGACIVSATCVYRSEPDPTCRRAKCRDSLDRIRQTTVDALRAIRPSQPMRFPILEGGALEHTDAGLCEACAQMVKGREREAKEEIWGLLPCIVDEVVPGWAGQCPKHCTAFSASGSLPDSDFEDLEYCNMDRPVHDWMRYRRTCQ
ncbi:hypothetical protein GSI_12054 [Ganoderma sinense ZZ0214-1]|uniref:Transcription factor domain-containing protein n=1 Tax=Ganoderma sinense ZZ0214-1 TaxID=1077348 RepID=A0A2G8RYA2_9APHY|nr:hypothetical protein GSI_12054 [Ganoderma sinense ZZ0214-1]